MSCSIFCWSRYDQILNDRGLVYWDQRLSDLEVVLSEVRKMVEVLVEFIG